MTVASETNRTALTSSGSLGPYSVGYIVISDADLAVYVAGTLKTLTTHYTVANAGTTSNATITFTAGNAPTSGDQIVMVRNVSLLQSYNPANGDAFDSEVLEGTIDRVYHAMQELGDKTDGTIKFSVGLSGSTGYNSDIATAGTITANKAARSNKGLMFDANGDITVTDDNPNEQVTLAEAQVALATTQATNAAGSGTTASEWATKDDGYVSGTGNSSKAWAIGGTYVTDTANRGASKEWAIEDSGTVDGTGHSSKEYAQGTQSGTGGSAKNWAQQTGADVTGGSTGDKSAKSWASETGANAPADGSSKEWATSTTEVAGGLKGAKGYAEDAAASYDSFDDRYLGTKSADPTLDNDGNALLTGALYYNTSASNMRVYSGSAWGVLDTLPQNLGATDTPTFATPTASGHAAIKSYVDANAGDSLPSQTGQSGKFLKTDGSSTSWDTASTLPAIASGDAGKQLTVNTAEDGTYWGGATPVTFTATLDTSATVTPFSFTDSSSVAWTVWEFTGNGTFSPSGPCTVDFMVVAGGGSGGDSSHWGAGGGAGELVWKTSQSFVEADYDVTVGDATTASSLTSQDGNDSSLSGTGISITAEGGGHGGDAGVGSAGGSGGGSSCSSNVGGTGNAEDDGDSTTFGFDGGAGHANCHFSGGGGGGAGGAGEDAGSGGSNTYGMGGNGGEGKDMSSYFGTTVGHDGWFAGGGGGFGYYHLDARRGYGNGGSTGKGGGGEGTESTNDDTTTIRSLGTDGMANTGGGGGGYAHNNYEGASSAYTKRGGSGVVILRVRKDS